MNFVLTASTANCGAGSASCAGAGRPDTMWFIWARAWPNRICRKVRNTVGSRGIRLAIVPIRLTSRPIRR